MLDSLRRVWRAVKQFAIDCATWTWHFFLESVESVRQAFSWRRALMFVAALPLGVFMLLNYEILAVAIATSVVELWLLLPIQNKLGVGPVVSLLMFAAVGIGIYMIAWSIAEIIAVLVAVGMVQELEILWKAAKAGVEHYWSQSASPEQAA